MNKLRKLECHMYSWACCRNRAIRCESGAEWMRRAVAQGAIGGLLLQDRVILRDCGADSAPVEVLGGFCSDKKENLVARTRGCGNRCEWSQCEKSRSMSASKQLNLDTAGRRPSFNRCRCMRPIARLPPGRELCMCSISADSPAEHSALTFSRMTARTKNSDCSRFYTVRRSIAPCWLPEPPKQRWQAHPDD